MSGVPDLTYDFVISAHVIEHLEDPLGAIRNAIRVLKRGGIFILVVPDRRFTFDKGRPPTPLAHVIADLLDGGAGTRHEAYCEHLRFHRPQWMAALPEAEIEPEARRMAEKRADTHFHCWTTDEFRELLDHAAQSLPFAVVGHTFVVNENIFVLRRHGTRLGPMVMRLVSRLRRATASLHRQSAEAASGRRPQIDVASVLSFASSRISPADQGADRTAPTPEEQMNAARRELSEQFIRGRGIEVGAGSRPFPIPAGARCFYGDVRDAESLTTYFAGQQSPFDGFLNAQTFAGIPDGSQDFVISAHVIEHLEDPIGAVLAALRILKPDGVLVLVVPDRRRTFDRLRPGTPLQHLVQDHSDGGASTRLQGYIDHARYVHPAITGETLSESQIQDSAPRTMAAQMDIHFHCWTTDEFAALLEYCCRLGRAQLLATNGIVAYENLFVVRKRYRSPDIFWRSLARLREARNWLSIGNPRKGRTQEQCR